MRNVESEEEDAAAGAALVIVFDFDSLGRPSLLFDWDDLTGEGERDLTGVVRVRAFEGAV